ncbi:MAG: hypothetical protein Q8O52_28910 [Sulfuritalea sp.]|nr:hypothetical protein [Sulfuritalea sp.]
MIREHKADLIEALKVGAGDTATASCWLLHYPERDPVEVACCPEATHAEILERYPDAVAAEPVTPNTRRPSAPMADAEEQAVLAWLELIGETDRATIAEVLNQCRQDVDAMNYFTGRAAAELPKPDPFPDDRRSCLDCLNLREGVCTITKPGDLVSARKGYMPVLDMPIRCTGYSPGAGDPDPRPGAARWPGLQEVQP